MNDLEPDDGVRIDGPSALDGGFFIVVGNDVWDGKRFRAFGAPRTFLSFKDSIREVTKARKWLNSRPWAIPANR